MKSSHLKRLVLLVALPLLLCAATPPPVLDSAPVLEDLSFEVNGASVTVLLKISRPGGPFRCGLSPAFAPEISVEFPEATSRLQARYTLDGRLVREAIVDGGAGDGGRPRVRFALAGGTLAGIEQTTQGLILRFQESSDDRRNVGGAGPSEYKVGVGDKLEVAVFGHEDLTKIVEVRSDGTINYPLTGDIQVRGMSVAEIDDRLTQILGKDFLVDPQVSVDVREYQSQWVTVIGEVRNPGRFVLKRDMRLIDVLAEAGGATKEAGAEILVTRRTNAGDVSQIAVNRDRLLSRDNQDSNIPLSHMDIVTVGEKKIFYIRGEVMRPGSYFLESELTLVKAISVAGGLTPFANRKEVQLIRSGSGSTTNDKKVINLKAIEEGKLLDIPLLPNDVIIVARRVF